MGRWARGQTSRWPGLRGRMSRKAMRVGVERTTKEAGAVMSEGIGWAGGWRGS